MTAIANIVVARWFSAAMLKQHPDVVAEMREMIEATPPEGYAWCCEVVGQVDLLEDLKSIVSSTLVMSGSDDLATPPAHGRRIADGIPGARFIEVPNVAHLGNYEWPELVNDLILNHLARPAGSTEREEA
jgi:pimeloyl-ACP methyl ester carboxylesterase